MNLTRRQAGLGRAVSLLCLLGLAGAASAQAPVPNLTPTLTPTLAPTSAPAPAPAPASADALAEWDAHGRAEGLARPDTPCQDFLQAMGQKPDYVEYLGCEREDDTQMKPLTARYRVSGAVAVRMEAHLRKVFGMPRLVFECCGWGSRPYSARYPADGPTVSVGMGVETPSYPREQWQKIPYFNITVAVFRELP